MAILWVRRKTGVGTGTAERGAQTFRTAYTVKSNIPRESRSAILACGMIPVYGAPHPENPRAVCVKVTVEQDRDNPFLWHVEAEWNANTGNRNPSDDQKQPDQRRPKWSGRFTPIQQYRFFDLNGVAFVDRAGTPFNPPPGIPIFVDEITVVRYEAVCNRTADRAYLNATNTDDWLGAAQYTALVADIDFQEVFEQGAYWFLKTYKVLVCPRIAADPGMTKAVLIRPPNFAHEQLYWGGWWPYPVLNAGPMEVGDDGKPKPIKKDGFYDGQPAPLNKDGKRIDRNADGSFKTPITYLGFDVVYGVPFAPLNLVSPWL